MELNMELLPGSGRHLYEQIYEYIRGEIRSGKLLAGERLPSTRQLAASLKIARTTVELAYEQLEEEGYLVIRRGSGAYVCETQNIPSLTEASRKPAGIGFDQTSQMHEKSPVLQENPKQEAAIDFSPRTIDMSMFPYATWRRILRGILTGDRADLFRRGDPQGDPELRTTIAHYLHLSRGCHCDPEQIVIGAGNDYLLMVLGILLGKSASVSEDHKGVRIGMESPTYLRAADVMRSMGFSIEPIADDESGMRADALEESDCLLAYLMPARQFPTGVVMPYPRRAELLSWAAEKEGRYLIEDDYDSEFKYRGRPVPSLQSMDAGGKVIYLGTFSKSIAPAIRVSYLILPKDLLPAFHEKAGFLSCTVPRLDQAILNEFIQEGYFERYLNRMRNHYRSKHDRMLELLKPLEKKFDIRGQGAGLHLVLHLKNSAACADAAGGQEKIGQDEIEQKLADAARVQGVIVYPLSEQKLPEEFSSQAIFPENPCSWQHLPEKLCSRQKLPENSSSRRQVSPAILLGYAALTEEEIREGTQKLIQAWS